MADLSFISLATVAAALVGLTDADPPVIWSSCVKPQFEAGRVEVSRGRGVIRDPAVRRRVVLGEVAERLCRGGRRSRLVSIRSPLRGGDGNVELFLHLRPPGAGRAQRSTRPSSTPWSAD